MSLHVIADEDVLVRAKMADHRLCDVIAIDLLSQLTNQHPSLLSHLLNLTLHTMALSAHINEVVIAYHQLLPSL